MLVQARNAPAASRPALIARAEALLRQTTALRLDDGSITPVDDSALARVPATDAGLDTAIRDLFALGSVARDTPGDMRAAEARLRALVGESRAANAEVSLIDLIARSIRRWLAEQGGEARDIAFGGIGIAALVLVLAVVGRNVRERFRREVVLPGLAARQSSDPAVHLREADEALRAGDVAAAIHALYRYAIAALATREDLRYDPSLTDRELLARARTVPHADALRDLVTLHELVWYGLRDARAEDAARARKLALEAAA